jgi:hypothetical protein
MISDLHASAVSHVHPIKMIAHHRRSTIIKYPFLEGQPLIPDAVRALLSLHQLPVTEKGLARRLLHHDLGRRPSPDAVSFHRLPLVTQGDLELGGLDVEFEERCQAQVLRLVVEDLGELGTLGYVETNDRFDVFLLLFPVGLSPDFPGWAVVKIILPVLLPDGFVTLRPLASDQLGEVLDLLLAFRASDPSLSCPLFSSNATISGSGGMFFQTSPGTISSLVWGSCMRPMYESI